MIASIAPCVSGLLLALNLLTFVIFAFDKARARAGGQRVAESTLLGLALIGGTPGAFAARHLFRHKTRKQPFRRRLHAIALLQLLGLAVWFWQRAG